MAMDPYARIFRPDFHANQEQPGWLPMGDDDQGDQIVQASGTFADLLKKRMARPKVDPLDQQAGAYANKVAGEPPPMAGVKSGGGMKSL